MTTKKATRRALFTSIMALVMCLVMLVGTTFAWFTDSVTSGVNTIKSGNLDVELTYKNSDGEFKTVDQDTLLFDQEALWEPGHVEYAVLTVKNVGSLALKYKLGINVANEVVGKTADNADIKLSEHLRYAVLSGDVTTADGFGRAALLAAAGEGTPLANTDRTGELYPAAVATEMQKNEDTVTLVVWMPTTVGNEANHDGTNVPSIDLGINLVATQKDSEEDSFGNDYDKDLAYPVMDAAAINDILKSDEGGSLTLGGSVKTDDYLKIKGDVDVTLGGNTWTVGDNTKVVDGADLEVTGGTILSSSYSGSFDVRPGTTTDSVVEFSNVHFINTYRINRTTGGSSTTHADYVLKYTPEAGGHTKFVFKNCTFDNSAVKFSGLSGSVGTFEAVFENCTFAALTNSELIEVGSYLADSSSITIRNCTFNVTATSNFSIVDGNYGRAATVNFEGSNSFNAVVATPTGADKKGTPEEIKIFSENLNVKACSAKTVNGLDTVTVSGIVTK